MPVPATATTDPRIGSVLQDRYRICEAVASGGMGVVYRGERLGLDRPVAIKFVHTFMAADPDILQRFQIEARAMSRVSHPACVSVIDVGVDGGAPYLVMDFVTGATLRKRLQAGPLTVDTVLAWMRQLLSGLAHAHALGIVHRDIKPENILLSEVVGLGTQVRILDFGVAKLLDSSSTLTSGLALGTPSYMAPEQAVGEAVTAATDVYAVGVLLFECLSGRKPFLADSLPALLYQHREEPAPLLRSLGVQVSPELEAVVARALAKSPGDRFAGAAAFSAALEATPEARGATPAVEVATQVGKRRPPGRRPAWIGALAGLVLLASAAGVVAWQGRAEPRAPAPSIASEPAVVAAAPAPAADGLPELARVDQLLGAGRWQDAVRLLQDLAAEHADNALVSYRLGTLYCEKYWGRQCIDAYREAVRRDPAYRADPVLIRQVIGLFVSDRHAWQAEKFLAEVVGASAVPLLEETRRSKNPVIRRRAERVLAQLR